MLIAARIKQLLDANKIVYRILPHQRASSLAEALNFLHLDPESLLTSQVLTDTQGLILVVYPYSTKIDYHKLNSLLHRNLKVLAEISVNRIFSDCEAGCWPPIGHPYGLNIILDSSIRKISQIYLNAGCYNSLLQIRLEDYLYINNRARFLNFVTPLSEPNNVNAPKLKQGLRFPEFSHVVLSGNKAIEHNFELWQHAFYAAAYARKITELIASKDLDPEMSYKAGLYHNFGMFLLSQLFNPEYNLLQKWLKQNPKTPVEVLEQRLLGMGQAFDLLRHGHAKLGENLLHHWGMPPEICVVAREHHNKNYSGQYAAYVSIIQIANLLLRQQGIGDEILTDLDTAALVKLGLQETAIRDAIKGIHLDAADIMQKAQALV